MRALRIIALLVWLFALPAFSQSQSPAHTHTFQMYLQQDRIFVQAKVNGSATPVILLVDTGTQTSVFDLSLCPKHDGLQELTVRTAVGSQRTALLDGTIELNGHNDGSEQFTLTTWQGKVLYGAFNFGTTQNGAKVYGLVGMDVLGQYSSVQFDFKNHTLTLTD